MPPIGPLRRLIGSARPGHRPGSHSGWHQGPRWRRWCRPGGGGLTLGPPTNTFNGATKAAAETARDTYAAANAAWLLQYDAEPTFTIVITWPVTPANTVYQSRRSSSWADVTGLVRGEKGAAGDDGSQSRFLVFAYINASTAPAAAPTGARSFAAPTP